MKFLLDTHIFIWWADQPEKLSPPRFPLWKMKLTAIKELFGRTAAFFRSP